MSDQACPNCSSLSERVAVMEVHAVNNAKDISTLSGSIADLIKSLNELKGSFDRRTAIEGLIKAVLISGSVIFGWFANKIHLGN